MKKALMVLLFLPVVSFADHHGGDGMGKGKNFDEAKAEALAGIDKRIAGLQEHKTCVSAAKDREGLKACHMKMKDMRMEYKEERMEKREERRGKWQDKKDKKGE